MRQLRQAGFETVLLDLPEAELRRRHGVRFAEEAWTNVQWLDWNRHHIDEHRAELPPVLRTGWLWGHAAAWAAS